tara:strand:- start:91 stop:351 length:261 start_codon:yes stop_codon:yes gene_type:complete
MKTDIFHHDFMTKIARAVSPMTNIEILDGLVTAHKNDEYFDENWSRFTASTTFYSTLSKHSGVEPISMFIILMDAYGEFLKQGGKL